MNINKLEENRSRSIQNYMIWIVSEKRRKVFTERHRITTGMRKEKKNPNIFKIHIFVVRKSEILVPKKNIKLKTNH